MPCRDYPWQRLAQEAAERDHWIIHQEQGTVHVRAHIYEVTEMVGNVSPNFWVGSAAFVVAVCILSAMVILVRLMRADRPARNVLTAKVIIVCLGWVVYRLALALIGYLQVLK